MSVVESQPSTAQRPGGYAELTAEIRRLGLLRGRPGFYAGLFAANLVALVIVVGAMLVLRDSWWALLLAPALAVVSGQTAFFGHDAGHRQVTRRSKTSNFLGRFNGNLLNGFSYGWWIDKHNAHHAHPNDLEADPDVQIGAFAFDPSQAEGRRGAYAWWTRHQAWMFFPVLTLETMNLHGASVRALARPGIRRRGLEAALIVAHFAAYVGLLVVALTWQQAIVFAVIHKALFGVYLGCSFAPNHKGMPTLTAAQEGDPLLRQVLTSRNVRGGPFVDVALGGLNYQIEHHLFPSMPRPNLRLAQPVVRRFCEARGVAYEEESAVASYVAVIRHLNAVGMGLPRRAHA